MKDFVSAIREMLSVAVAAMPSMMEEKALVMEKALARSTRKVSADPSIPSPSSAHCGRSSNRSVSSALFFVNAALPPIAYLPFGTM